MEFIYGILATVSFFIVLLSVFYIGFKRGKKKTNTKPLDEIEKQRQKKMREDFLKIMQYDIDTAYGRKKVTK